MIIKKEKEFKKGYNSITSEDDKQNNTMMDFGIIILKDSDVYINSEKKERVFLIMNGEVLCEYDEISFTITRNSLFDESPYVLHIPNNINIKLIAKKEAEICYVATKNDVIFQSKLYNPKDVRSEYRGKGTMKETSTRIVRTVFDKSNAPQSNLVIGEVINYPGKWSSYPPHHHPQPEIYHYRFLPKQGFGISILGDDAYKIYDGDTVLILDDKVHPQVSAPGYAMYYIWAIRHLENNPYITPTFDKEHLWVMEKNASIWPEEE
ncbi:5-deoxyglucuronate isomerase [Marinitoga hydrogenitolerans DSM 16785]|uniref:5-deoxyglucuronate isomerase n=1 Tax=Marinitoga hydrogenitolerans (strain DSM 16785 / JCM 12826 / AT1271) TaxID=1122195 RepID=A0A1M4SHZ0_MARH1|nr:5-deoxy-glucuronate isomerase [Marinitoga hydrogenitolerans]SHE31806.1 5-deoxyglucuronate isomerase [Marinitoga hydrogenitolerans DSM 16785]